MTDFEVMKNLFAKDGRSVIITENKDEKIIVVKQGDTVIITYHFDRNGKYISLN